MMRRNFTRLNKFIYKKLLAPSILFIFIGLTQKSDAQMLPFSCNDGIAYQVAGSTASSLYSYNLVTGVRSLIGGLYWDPTRSTSTGPISLSSAGLNPVDNMVWGYRNNMAATDSYTLLRIDRTGKTQSFSVPNLPIFPASPTTGTSFNCGEILPGGYLVLYNTNGGRIYTIDVDPNRASYLQLVDPLTHAVQTGPEYGTALSSSANINDFAYYPATGLLQGITNAPNRKLVTINPSTGAVVFGNPVTSPAGSEFLFQNESGNFGASFSDANGSYYTFANSSSHFYRVDLNTAIATYLSTSDPSTNNDGISCLGAVISYNIQGTVFNDSNGLQGFPANTVDGTPTNISGALYVILFNNTTGKVDNSTAVRNDGTFDLAGFPGDDYTLYLSTIRPAVGSTAVPTVVLPAGWVSTGENLGSSSGHDGSPDGILPLGPVAGNLTNANFGIERKPTANTVTATIIQPTIGTEVVLDGNGTNPPMPSGQDPEDGPLGENNTIVITTVPPNSSLYYKGVLVTNGSEFADFDPSQLKIVVTSATQGSSSTSFTYQFKDAAGVKSDAATYTLTWKRPLSVNLISFEGKLQSGSVLLTWKTSQESNVSGFELEGSADGQNWTTINKQSGSGNATTTQSYSYVDGNPSNGNNLYRLKMIDMDGSFSYSNIVLVNMDRNQKTKAVLYPNPASDKISILNINAAQIKMLQIITADGKVIRSLKLGSLSDYNISNLSSGMYLMKIIKTNGEVENIPFVKQ